MDSLRSSKKTIILILTVATLTLILSSVISILLNENTPLKFPSIGKMKTIGVEAYWKDNLENVTEEINWGIIWVGSSKNVTIYLRSISNVETVLQLNATNWNPTHISRFINFSWS